MRNKKSLRILILLLLIVIISIAGFTVSRMIGDHTKTASNIHVTRNSEGGIGGVGDGKNFTISESQIKFQNKMKPLTQEQTALIIKKLDDAHFFSLKKSYTCVKCADQFTNKLDIKLGANSNTVTFEDGSDAPSGLIELDNYLLSLLP